MSRQVMRLNQDSKNNSNNRSSAPGSGFRNKITQADRQMNLNARNGVATPSNMSSGAAEYAHSLADPFTDYQACIPDYPALFTGRIHTFAKGTVSTGAAGSTGFGFIVIDPSRGVVSDGSAVKLNTAASVLTFVNLTAGANLASFNSNSNYATSGIGTAQLAQYRVVSCGLRIRYIGAELNRGGILVGMHHPAHFSLHGYNISGLDAYSESSRLPVIREWSSVVYHPVDTDDLDWQSTFPTFTPASTDSSYYMGFLIQAPDTSGATPMTFEWEAHWNYELSGPTVLNKEVSHVDPVGHGAVNAAAMITEPVRKAHNIPTKTVASGLVTAASHYIAGHVSNPSKPPEHPAHTSSNPTFWSSLMGIGQALLPRILSFL